MAACITEPTRRAARPKPLLQTQYPTNFDGSSMTVPIHAFHIMSTPTPAYLLLDSPYVPYLFLPILLLRYVASTAQILSAFCPEYPER